MSWHTPAVDRRSFLRGLLALPFVGQAVKHAPKSWADYVGGQTVKMDLSSTTVGTLHRYSRADLSYLDHGIKSIKVKGAGPHTFIRTGR